MRVSPTAIEAWPLAARMVEAIGSSSNLWEVVVGEVDREVETGDALLVELDSLYDGPIRRVSVHAVDELIVAAIAVRDDLLVVSIESRWSERDWRALDVQRSRLMRRGMTVLIVGRDNVDQMVTAAPNLWSWIGSAVWLFASRPNTMAESLDDKRARERRELRSKLQARVLEGAPKFDDDVMAYDVWRGIKAALATAYGDDLLTTPPEVIHKCIPKPVVDRNLVMISGGLVDGKKPFGPRTPDKARLVRSDGAWLHFTLTLECVREGKHKGKAVDALWAYDFELVLPDGHTPPFVRFDLNEPGHPNELREIRSHMHPGNDDLLLPAPIMTPCELIDVLVRGFRNRRDDKKPRR